MNVVLFGGITAKLCRASSPQSFEKINAKRKWEPIFFSKTGAVWIPRCCLVDLFHRIYVVFALVVLTGVTWIMEIVSFVAGGNANIWIFTDVLNISTGIFVFFIFVCNKRVRSLICGRQDTQDTEEPVEMVSNSQMPSSWKWIYPLYTGRDPTRDLLEIFWNSTRVFDLIFKNWYAM